MASETKPVATDSAHQSIHRYVLDQKPQIYFITAYTCYIGSTTCSYISEPCRTVEDNVEPGSETVTLFRNLFVDLENGSEPTISLTAPARSK
jgi:hypothetical protein